MRIAAAVMVLSSCTSGTDAVVAVGGGYELVSPGGQTEFTYPPQDRKPIGELAGPRVDGKGRVSTHDYRGSVLVVNVWGKWCSSCRAEGVALLGAARSLTPRGVAFLGLDVRDLDIGTAHDYEQVLGATYPSIYDPAMRTILSMPGYPVSTVPSSFVLDRQGRVAYLQLGAITDPAAFEHAVSAVAAET